jgi:hypothetical protein
MMKEILEALKILQMNQVQLASNVDAISGRVNVLAGMKEVRDVAVDSSAPKPKKSEAVARDESIESLPLDETKVPESPSLPASQVDGLVSHKRTTSSGTSRIILT